MSYIDEKKNALLVLAFPQLIEKDRDWIDFFRKEHDTLFYGVVEPHFTLVFPTFGIEIVDFIDEIQKKSQSFQRFNFIIRSAMLNNDRLSDFTHIFLSPDEGNSNIIKMHDHLYSGILKQSLRLDIDFFSHIAIGSYKNPEKCKLLVDEVNSQEIEIKGSVVSLDIVSYGDRKVKVIETITLK